MPIQVAVCGPRHATTQEETHAYEVGALLAKHGVTVICGGGIGVMAAVARGVRANDGVVIGIRPTANRADASPDLSAVIVTNMGEARNAIIAWSADAMIAVGGSWGTLSEIALAMRRGGIPVVALGGWQVVDPDTGAAVPGIIARATPQDAVTTALAGVRRPSEQRP